MTLLKDFIEAGPVKVTSDPSQKLVGQVAGYVDFKDAPIIASALKHKVDYVVSYDRKDLTDNQRVKQQSGLKIVAPKEVVLNFS